MQSRGYSTASVALPRKWEAGRTIHVPKFFQKSWIGSSMESLGSTVYSCLSNLVSRKFLRVLKEGDTSRIGRPGGRIFRSQLAGQGHCKSFRFSLTPKARRAEPNSLKAGRPEQFMHFSGCIAEPPEREIWMGLWCRRRDLKVCGNPDAFVLITFKELKSAWRSD